MTKYIFSFLLIFALVSTSFMMDGGDKLKVKFKKGTILVEKKAWGNYKRTGAKDFYSTLSGVEYIGVNGLSYGTGKYFTDSKGVKREYSHFYSEIHFLTTEIEKFETDLVHKELVRALIADKVIENDVFNKENAEKFKTKYEDNISEKRFLTK
ncbi:hypothetical protein OAD98_00130 [Flavobacteriales bacterium]|nr:hypothetical protein [Flavobacteriales bacterium]